MELNNSQKKFKNLVKKSLLLTPEESLTFEKIPNELWADVFEVNFDSNIKLAEEIILNNKSDYTFEFLRKEHKKIKNLNKASNILIDGIEKGKKILFATDTDNDGSLSQAALIEFLKVFPDNENLSLQYTQTVNKNSTRGLTVDMVDLWASSKGVDKNEDFIICTADNGINSRTEQEKINKSFPNAKIVITDHHLPDPDEVIIENKNTIIFNPKYKPTKYFEKKNISGAATLVVLLEEVISKLEEENSITNHMDVKENLFEIAKAANLLDYVNTSIGDKPVKDFLIEKYVSLGSLMNLNNSLNKVITGNLTEDFLESLSQNIEGIDNTVIKDSINKIQEQNHMAYLLLSLNEKYKKFDKETVEKLEKNDFYDLLTIQLTKSTLNYENINPNYIEQLRPIIYNYSIIENKNAFENEINNNMVKVYENIRKAERDMIEEFRKGNIMHSDKLENSTILYPLDKKILSLFNRKFLGKVYNEENNGILLILDNIEKEKVSGSFRSLYDIQDILKGKEKLEKLLKIKIKFMGHDRAAGFVITSEDGDIKPQVITAVNKFMNNRISELKMEEKSEFKNYILSDLSELSLIDKINRKIKGNLTNMTSINPIIKFNKSTYLTEKETLKQKNLQQLIKDKKYGYVIVNMNFHGDALIIPTELLRNIVNSNFKDYIEMNYIDNGVFIAARTLDNKKVTNIVKLKNENNYQKELLDFYKEKYLKDGKNEVDLSYEKIKEMPYFKNNNYGDLEYSRFENFVIRIIDSSDSDILCVLDTEGTGLGQAPKCLNIGALNLMIDENSGFEMSKNDFEKSYFKSNSGERFLLNEEDRSTLINLTPAKIKRLSFNDKRNLLKNENGDLFLSPEGNSSFKKMHNFKIEGNKVLLNRNIKTKVISYLINDTDFKLTQEIEDLTGITNTMLNVAGMRTWQVDEEFTNKFEGKKVIFQAHNLPYDLGVIKANMPKLFNKMSTSLLSDSAMYSRIQKLAYDNIPVGSFPSHSYLKSFIFYDSDYSDISLSKFLSNEEDSVLPDKNGKFVLKRKNKIISLIDKESNNEVRVEENTQELKDMAIKKEMPNNGIKYSVEQLSLHETVRNILLANEVKKIKAAKIPEELASKKQIIEHFMMNYHFDNSLKENVFNFISSLDFEEKLFFENEENIALLESLSYDFLDKNKEIEKKFTEAWVYKKILHLIEPKREDINDEVLDILSYQTEIPKDKVKQVLEDTVFFKEKFGLEKALVNEVHNNIIYEGENLGDVMLESVLTLKRLVDKNYNSYKHDSEDAVNMYLNNAWDTSVKFLIREMKEIALDSYSARQTRSYTRKIKTDFVEEGNDFEKTRIKFKLSSGILPPDSFIYGELKEHINEEKLNELSSKIEFIIKIRQLKNSAMASNSITGEVYDSLIEILEANNDKVSEYEEDLKEYFYRIDFTRRDANKKKIAGQISDVSLQEEPFIRAPKLSEPFYQEDISDLESFINNLKDLNNRFKVPFNEDSILQLIDKLPILDVFREDLKNEQQDSFIPSVDIARRDVVKWGINNAPEVFRNILKKDSLDLEMDLKEINKIKIKIN